MSMIGCFTSVGAEQLQNLIADPAQVAEYLHSEGGEANTLDLDKAWHGIHYLLTGEAWGGKAPLAWAVLGGKEIGEDVGYGPARYLMPVQVDAVAQSLAEVDEAQFRARYQPRTMDQAQIYPSGIWERDGADGLDYLAQYYKELVQFYSEAAARGDGVLLWLS